MCQLLVKLADGHRPANGLPYWRRGDVIVVAEDEHQWGRLERPPTFAIIRFPGWPVESAAVLLEMEFDLTELRLKRRGLQTAQTHHAKQTRHKQFDFDQLEVDEIAASEIGLGVVHITDGRTLNQFHKDVAIQHGYNSRA